MDSERYDYLAGEVRALLIAVGNRLPAEDSVLVAEFVDHAEFGVAVEWMAERVDEVGVALSHEELDWFRRLSSSMGGLELPESFA